MIWLWLLIILAAGFALVKGISKAGQVKSESFTDKDARKAVGWFLATVLIIGIGLLFIPAAH